MTGVWWVGWVGVKERWNSDNIVKPTHREEKCRSEQGKLIPTYEICNSKILRAAQDDSCAAAYETGAIFYWEEREAQIAAVALLPRDDADKTCDLLIILTMD